MPKVIKKSHPGVVFDGLTGQVIESSIPPPVPDDIPSIVEGYITLVGKVLGRLSAKEAEKGLDNKEVNAVVALGRTIGGFAALEEARISRVGGKALKERTTEELRKMLTAGPEPEETDDE